MAVEISSETHIASEKPRPLSAVGYILNLLLNWLLAKAGGQLLKRGGIMLRFLATTALRLIGVVLGLFVAKLLLDGFDLQFNGFIITTAIFLGLTVLLQPFMLKMSMKYIPALSGGVALVATAVSLIITSFITDTITISGWETWFLAPIIIWGVVVVASVILPMFMFKELLGRGKERAAAK